MTANSEQTSKRRRGRVVQLWLSKDQMEAVQDAARKKDLPIATYIRLTVLELVGWEAPKKIVDEDDPTF